MVNLLDVVAYYSYGHRHDMAGVAMQGQSLQPWGSLYKKHLSLHTNRKEWGGAVRGDISI